MVVSLSLYMFEPGFDDTDTQQQMKTQIDKGAKAAAEQAGAAASAVTGGVAIFAGVGQILLSGALAQIWGMINGLQVFVHMPVFAIDLPSTSMIVVKSILSVATFDLPSIDA